MPTEASRIVSVRLSDAELTSLNLLMEKQGYKGLGELLGVIATGKYKIGVEEVTQAVESLLPKAIFFDQNVHNTNRS